MKLCGFFISSCKMIYTILMTIFRFAVKRIKIAKFSVVNITEAPFPKTRCHVIEHQIMERNQIRNIWECGIRSFKFLYFIETGFENFVVALHFWKRALFLLINAWFLLFKIAYILCRCSR